MKSKISLLIVLFFTSLISCNEDDEIANKCESNNPIEDLAWLKKKITNVEDDEYSYYSSAIYKNNIVFFNHTCNPLVNYISTTYDCEGKVLGNTADFEKYFSDIKIIWKHPNSKCNDNGEVQFSLIGSRYSNGIEGCENPVAEMNCTRTLEFRNETKVGTNLYGGDIIYDSDYLYDKEKGVITIKGQGINGEMILKVISNTELKEVKNDKVWKRIR